MQNIILGLGCLVFLISFLKGIFRIINKGGFTDHAPVKNKVGKAIIYSFTGAMSPKKKESAKLYKMAYLLGMVFHLGIFLGIVISVLMLIGISVEKNLLFVFSVVLVMSTLSGILLLIKRINSIELTSLSVPDDYVSNLIVTGFQIIVFLSLWDEVRIEVLSAYLGVLLAYMPISKLRHAIYFFTSRIHLGIMYGRKGVW